MELTDFVRVAGGTFEMGTYGGDVDETVHPVTVQSFFMGKYEVTQKEWQTVMGNYLSYFEGDNLPVECVSWYDAIEFCNKLSECEGLRPVYFIDKSRDDPNNENIKISDDPKWVVTPDWNANGYRLPTEAEWEYAAKGGNKGLLQTVKMKYKYSGSNQLDAEAWHWDNSGETTHEVGTKASNSLGLYDMSG